jgi:hypothetical protein
MKVFNTRLGVHTACFSGNRYFGLHLYHYIDLEEGVTFQGHITNPNLKCRGAWVECTLYNVLEAK